MSTISRVTLTTPTGVIDVDFVGGGVVTLTHRKSATAKTVLALETLAPKPEFMKGRGTLVGALMTAIANDRDLSTLGLLTF